MPSSPVIDAINNLALALSPLTYTGGRATNLSTLQFGSSVPYYFLGNTVGSQLKYQVKQYDQWARFFEELWEVPPSNLIGTNSTGVIYILPTGSESDGEANINRVMKYDRRIPISVIAVWLHEGTPDEYEQISDAIFKDACQDHTLGDKVTALRWRSLERLHPNDVGVAGVILTFDMDLFMATN